VSAGANSELVAEAPEAITLSRPLGGHDRQRKERRVNLDIRQTIQDDVDVVIDILAEVSAWLRTKGITQWPARFPSDFITQRVDSGELYVARLGTDVVATITLQWSDSPFWGRRDDAGFIHRLAVRRSHAGIGRMMIEWAEGEVASKGRCYLCLDCLTSNMQLRQYYQDLGFQTVGEIVGPKDHPHSIAHGPWQATLHERAIGGLDVDQLAPLPEPFNGS
jgi:GNAT superfamily N-acetyltransferase